MIYNDDSRLDQSDAILYAVETENAALKKRVAELEEALKDIYVGADDVIAEDIVKQILSTDAKQIMENWFTEERCKKFGKPLPAAPKGR